MPHDIKIQFLGTGSAWSRRFGNTSALVTVVNNNKAGRLLIDCGRTAPDDLYRHGYTWKDVDAIFISHLHGDHVYGLEDAGFRGRYEYNKKPHLVFPQQRFKTDLWDKVLRGTMAQGDLARTMTLDDYFTYTTVEPGAAYFEFNGVMFSVYPTEHIPNKKSYGIIIGEKNFIIYTADSLLSKDLIKIAVQEGAQAIFHDCQFLDSKVKVHASLSDLESLDKAEKDKIHIMHYSDDISDYFLRIKESGLKITVRGQEYNFQVD